MMMTQAEVYQLLKLMHGQKMSINQICKLMGVSAPTNGNISRKCQQLYKYRVIKCKIEKKGMYKVPYFYV